MIPSPQLLERLKRHEGFRSRPYLCPAGRVTIGHGHNLEADPSPIRPWSHVAEALAETGILRGEALLKRLRALDMSWDARQAATWLASDVEAVIGELESRCPAYLGLARAALAPASDAHGAVARFAAAVRAEVLIDMAYNLGVGGLLGFKRALAAVEAGDFPAAAAHMMDSRWAAQVGRRAVELAGLMRAPAQACVGAPHQEERGGTSSSPACAPCVAPLPGTSTNPKTSTMLSLPRPDATGVAPPDATKAGRAAGEKGARPGGRP